MKQMINDFVDRFPAFHKLASTKQILFLIYFHTVEDGRGSANQADLENLFRLAGLALPKNLGHTLGYLCGRGAKLLPPKRGEYELRREVKRELGEELRGLRGEPAPIVLPSDGPFEFKDRTFADKKIAALLDELRRCHATQCWNACGLLMRIVIERAVDTFDPAVKAKSGLKDKLNKCREIQAIPKSVRESIDHLHGAKIIGDIAAHGSMIVLEQPDINLALPHFRLLLKSI